VYAALPPEMNTGRLIAGAMAEPYLQAEVGWQLLATQFSAALATLHSQIAAMSSIWEGMAAERAQAAFAPYVGWMTTVIGMAEQRAVAAAAQAAAYTAAVATTPTLAEIAQNHVTHAVLEATNFLGVNAVPLAANEFQYFVVLWNRAAAAMFEYQAATGVNITFPLFPPAPPIMAAPGAPQAGLAAVLAQTAAGLPNSVARNALLASLDAQSAAGTVENGAQLAAMAAATTANGSQMQSRAGSQVVESAAQGAAGRAGDSSSQMVQQVSQMASQAPQMVAQLPQQMGQALGQGPQQLMQMASQPMQQLTSLFQQGGLGPANLAGQGITPEGLAAQFGSVEQLGMYGTSPIGSAGGAFGGAGLLSGAGGGVSMPLRTPAGWTAPLAAPPAAALPAAAPVSALTAAVPGSGSGAVGSGTSMMGPLAAGAAARSAGQAVVAGAGPVVQEAAVAATVGFEAFDDGS
jgi:PPE-repeat protein